MCKICVDWNKGALTTSEALRNLGEIGATSEHVDEVIELVLGTDDNDYADVDRMD